MATLAIGLRARFGRAGLAPAGFHQGFHRLISVPPLPRFSQRDNNVGPVKLFLCELLRSLLGALVCDTLLTSALMTTARL
jgi:hypothetical protein